MTPTADTNAGPASEFFLPLRPAWYFVLLAIAHGDRHGHAIRKRALKLSSGQVKLWPTTLYGTLHELELSRLVDEIPDEELLPEDEDGRCRFYRLTRLGRDVLRAETARLEVLVTTAKGAVEA